MTNNIGVLSCPKNIEEVILKRDIHNYTPMWLREFLLKKMHPVWKTIKLEELGTVVFAVQFPSIRESLNQLSECAIIKYCSEIELLLMQLNIKSLVLDIEMNKIRQIEDYFSSRESIYLVSGRELFFLYFEEVLKMICKLIKVSLNCIGIGIIADDLGTREVQIVKSVAKDIRFLSILSLNYEKFIDIAESIYKDTGLVVNLSKDTKDTLKKCQVIFNFSKDNKFINTCKLPDYSVVINYGSGISNKNLKGVIINSLNIYSSNTLLRPYPWFNQLSFCEAMMQRGDEKILTNNNEDIRRNYLSILKELGYRISGFIGQNGKIDMSEFHVLATRNSI